MTMFRFRRYRVFLICAVLIVTLIFRLKRSNGWESISPVDLEGLSSLGEGVAPKTNEGGTRSPAVEPVKQHVDIEKVAHADEDIPVPQTPTMEVSAEKTIDTPTAESKPEPAAKPEDDKTAKSKDGPVAQSKEDTAANPKLDSSTNQKANSQGEPEDMPGSERLVPAGNLDATKTTPQVIIPDRKPISPAGKTNGDSTAEELHAVPAGRVDPIIISPSPSPIHWKKQPEHFPVPSESIIQLPTGQPIPMPRIQFQFPDETPTAKIEREKRLGLVKTQFLKAWNGYKKYAWMHDELVPESGEFKDPFCGWAATMVDSLDTLWIMGLEEDFVEAVEGVKNIDFTTCTRPDLQVFEITIRYLGGLIGAYEISGQVYKVLLEKAVELGDILMGVFDTPNRMPVLFYQWKPAFASQAHRAGTRANLAELGSLSVEFTRLAQLTKEPKYYDAVARITNALEDWQKRGTVKMKGVFPDDVDASGCNRTIGEPDAVKSSGNEDILPGYQATLPKAPKEGRPRKKGGAGKDDLELQVTPGQPGKGTIRKVEKEEMLAKAEGRIAKREVAEVTAPEGHTPPPDTDDPVDAGSGDATIAPALAVAPLNGPESPTGNSSVSSSNLTPAPPVAPLANEHAPNSGFSDWDCVPQGLESPNLSRDMFSMGGGQDSTYEYFSKEFMLLGGLEPKYRTMYLETMNAVRKYMLYRPMIPGANILFSGRVSTGGDPDNDAVLEPEVTHLTCFLGGMVGMGAKLFDLEADIEIAKKLTDGCVWAYASTEAGVMVENAAILPCKSVTDCPFNETLWWQHLDPSWHQREQMIKDYDETKAKVEAQRLKDNIAAENQLAAIEEEGKSSIDMDMKSENSTISSDGVDVTEDNVNSKDRHVEPDVELPPSAKIDVDSPPPPSTRDENKEVSGPTSSTSDQTTTPEHQVHKRQVADEIPNPEGPQTPADEGQGPESPKTADQLEQEAFDRKKQQTQQELDTNAVGRDGNVPGTPVTQQPVLPDSGDNIDLNRPLNHTAYVKARIEREGLKPGYINIVSDRYILRPEAIESVWYMYRITGDREWQEKGWHMFESIINATSARYGHSAVNGVANGHLSSANSMESFWLAETLKYFYLLYSTPDIISLDDWVLNTEAHPFKRPS